MARAQAHVRLCAVGRSGTLLYLESVIGTPVFEVDNELQQSHLSKMQEDQFLKL